MASNLDEENSKLSTDFQSSKYKKNEFPKTSKPSSVLEFMQKLAIKPTFIVIKIDKTNYFMRIF